MVIFILSFSSQTFILSDTSTHLCSSHQPQIYSLQLWALLTSIPCPHFLLCFLFTVSHAIETSVDEVPIIHRCHPPQVQNISKSELKQSSKWDATLSPKLVLRAARISCDWKTRANLAAAFTIPVSGKVASSGRNRKSWDASSHWNRHKFNPCPKHCITLGLSLIFYAFFLTDD